MERERERERETSVVLQSSFNTLAFKRVTIPKLCDYTTLSSATILAECCSL